MRKRLFITLKMISAMLLTAIIVLYIYCYNELSCSDNTFSFIVTADMREYAGPEYQTDQYFLGACKAIKEIGHSAFMISPGDIDPPWYVSETVKKVLGDDYEWYPVVGNHEAKKKECMVWLREWGKRNLNKFKRKGPVNGVETNYSFDYKNGHFIVLNEYYNGKSDTGADSDISDSLFAWIEKDLEENNKPVIFVFGHEPIISIQDYDNGRIRHKGSNLDSYPENSNRFQHLLKKYNVKAYVCGHTHNFSYAKINGLWQIDAGHCRGIGDRGTRSTFLNIVVSNKKSYVEVYRDDAEGGKYSLTLKFDLD